MWTGASVCGELELPTLLDTRNFNLVARKAVVRSSEL